MVSVVSLAVVYVVGGITFLPLCAALLVAIVFYSSPAVVLPPKTGIPALVDDQGDDAEPRTVYRAGWLTVRRTYEPMKEGAGDGTYAGMLASSYRSFMDQRSRDPRRSKPKDRFFAVLKQKTLFLYEGEEQAECWAAIDVAAHDVVIYPEGNVDGELYVKRTAIELKPRRTADPDAQAGDKGGEAATAASPVVGEPSTDDAAYDVQTGKPLPWFIFAKVNSDKEDWFHSLVLSSRLGYPDSATAVARDRALFDPVDMARLMEQIDQQPDSIPMRWFNALLGRVFLSTYRTSTLEDYLTSRIVRKLKRVKTPAMLSEIQVREVNVGSAVPLFSKPMLKELTPEGDASMEVHVAYVGEARVTIETQATVSLGSRFKPYVVRLVLAIVLRELEGTLLVKVKQPPSNRVWFGFRDIPRMALSVEPVVSTRQIKWSLVTGPIESRIRELIAESLVLPHMDDLSFFDTRSEPLSRGGIYGPFLRRERPSQEEELDAPPRPDREVGEDAPEDVVVGAEDSGSGSTASTSARERRPEVRRRRSSEGDRPLELTRVSSASTSTTAAGSAAASSAKSASSSSVASLANGLTASLASWREKNGAGSSTSSLAGSAAASSSEAGAGGGAGPKKKSSWFAKSGSSASSLASGRTAAAESTDSLASSGASMLSTDTVAGGSTTSTGATPTPQEEVSAAKLRQILTQRAESREREKEEREREEALREAREAVAAEDERLRGDGEGEGKGKGAASRPSRTRGLSNLSLTAPGRSDTDSAPAMPLVAPALQDGAPLKLNEPVEETQPHVPATSASASARAPPLPSRPSWIKPAAPPPSSDTSATSAPDPAPVPAPPPGLVPSTVPAPPLRRHSPSASVDSPNPSAPAGSTLLSSWRTRVNDKEALAAGVASAKESMRRWGATWSAKRAQGSAPPTPGAGGDMDRPVGDGEERVEGKDGSRERGTEREAYRDYRARAASPAGSTSSSRAAGARGDEVPRTPPRAIPTAGSGFKPSTSSLPVVQVSPSNALGTSPTKPPAPLGSSASKVGGGGGTGYRPVQMMSLPGIKDEERRRRVREDHIGGGARTPVEQKLAAVAEPRAGPPVASSASAQPVTDEAASSSGGATPVVPSAAVGRPGLADEAAPAQAPALVDAVEPRALSNSPESPGSSKAASPPVAAAAEVHPLPPSTPPRTASPTPIDVPALPPRPPAVLAVEASPPPPLPPRKDGVAHVDDAALPPLPPRPTDATPTKDRAPPPLPPRADEGDPVEEDALADEAGWGLQDEVPSEESATVTGSV
ncbi:hypothetical protein JCM3775_005164 [Rhodotorula graminis]